MSRSSSSAAAMPTAPDAASPPAPAPGIELKVHRRIHKWVQVWASQCKATDEDVKAPPPSKCLQLQDSATRCLPNPSPTLDAPLVAGALCAAANLSLVVACRQSSAIPG